jgi:transcriptional regulator GlxA family with amidase domain
MTVRDYLNRVRVEIAGDLLSHTDESLSEIAAFVGFFDASHLSRVFYQLRRTRPSAHRRSTSMKSS